MSNLTKLFLKTLGITLGVAAVIFTAGWLTLRYTVKPPVVADSSNPGIHEPKQNGSQEAAFIRPEVEDAEPDDELPFPEPPDAAERKLMFYTFLIFGLDDGINVDTVMVAAYDGVKKQAYVIGIPRDSKINVSFRPPKIHAAYMVGTYNGGGMEGGVNRLKREIYKIFGFVPDYYICMDFDAFIRIVDAVNGIEIDVPFDMVYTDPYQNLHINIPKGLQTLYGQDALHFARYRRGNDSGRTISDYQRIENQQTVIQAVLNKLMRPASILRIPEFISIFSEHVHSDIKVNEMLWFAEQLNEIRNNPDALETYTLPTAGTSGAPDWFELLDEEAVIELINRTVNPYLREIGPEDLDIAM